MAFFKKVDDIYICEADTKFYINEAQILDNTVKEYVVLGYGRMEQGSNVKTYVHGCAITTIPDHIEDTEDGTMKILVYKKGDTFCKGTFTVRDSTYVQLYGNITLQGKLLTNIPYEAHRVIRDNIMKRNHNIKVPMIFFDISTAFFLRSKKDPMKEYRTVSQGEYITMNTREMVSQSAGTFGAATFEDPATMTFINVTRKDKEEGESALEKYMLM